MDSLKLQIMLVELAPLVEESDVSTEWIEKDTNSEDWSSLVGACRTRGELLGGNKNAIGPDRLLSPGCVGIFLLASQLQTQWESVFSQWSVVLPLSLQSSDSLLHPVQHLHTHALDMLAETLHTPRNDRNNSMHASLHLSLYDGNMVCVVTQEV